MNFDCDLFFDEVIVYVIQIKFCFSIFISRIRNPEMIHKIQIQWTAQHSDDKRK